MTYLKGLIPVLITPLNSDQTLDIAAMHDLCEYYLNLKVDGLWVLGTGGEDMCLSYQQRLEVASEVTSYINGRCKIILGTSFFSIAESFKFIDDTCSLNFHAYHAMPYHQKVSLRQLRTWYLNIADKCQAVDKKIWAYTSGNWATRMPSTFIRDLKDHKSFEGVKYSSSNILDIQQTIWLQDSSFQVITAVVKTLYSCLSLGITAATTVEATLFPKLISSIFNEFSQGNIREAANLQQKLNSLLNYPSPAQADNFLRVAEIKYLTSKFRNCGEYVTSYYRLLCPSEKLLLDKFYSEHSNHFGP